MSDITFFASVSCVPVIIFVLYTATFTWVISTRYLESAKDGLKTVALWLLRQIPAPDAEVQSLTMVVVLCSFANICSTR